MQSAAPAGVERAGAPAETADASPHRDAAPSPPSALLKAVTSAQAERKALLVRPSC